MLGVSEGLVRLEIQRGRLRINRLGHRILIPSSEVLKLAGLETIG